MFKANDGFSIQRRVMGPDRNILDLSEAFDEHFERKVPAKFLHKDSLHVNVLGNYEMVQRPNWGKTVEEIGERATAESILLPEPESARHSFSNLPLLCTIYIPAGEKLNSIAIILDDPRDKLKSERNIYTNRVDIATKDKNAWKTYRPYIRLATIPKERCGLRIMGWFDSQLPDAISLLPIVTAPRDYLERFTELESS